MTSRRYHIQEDTNLRILGRLEDKLDITQQEIAEKLGVTRTFNYSFDALIGKGQTQASHSFMPAGGWSAWSGSAT